MDVKEHLKVWKERGRASGREGGGVASFTELRSCVKVEVDVLSSPSVMVSTVSVDVRQDLTTLTVAVVVVTTESES